MRNMLLTIILISTLCANAASADIVTQVYQKIDNTQVPADVLRNASSKYSGYVLSKAYLCGNGTLKLVMSKSGKTVDAFFKNTGQFIKTKS